MKKVIIPVLVAVLFWFVMFSPWTKDYVNFWITMGFAGATLTLMSALLGDNFRNQFQFSVKDIFIGIASAVFLYFVFYFGEYFSTMLVIKWIISTP